MDTQTKFDLITRNLEEVVTPEDLLNYLNSGLPLNHYIGFEISGHIHLGTGLVTGSKIADFQKAGFNCSFFLATYHAWINNKLGGDIETIRKASKYFAEGIKLGVEIMGGDPEKVKLVFADDLYHHNDLYWQTVIDVAKSMTLNRALRSITIMGRKEGENVELASLMYAPMQVADIFIQDLTMAHSGLDQRKAHMIAREVALKLNTKPLLFDGKKHKPVALHQHLIAGLHKPPIWPVPKEKLQELQSEMKMSKSIPGSAIFLHDSEDDIRNKMRNAFCPEGIIDYNPVLDWAKHIVFSKDKAVLNIERPDKFGGNLEFDSYLELEKTFAEKQLHPQDLKNAMAEYLVKLLEPARKRFQKPEFQEIIGLVNKSVTR